jgi:enoyl-[acyl-carrier protein] reductase II
MFEGDMEQGELEIGQVSSMIGTIKPAAAVVEEIWVEHHRTCRNLSCSQTVGNSSK